MTARIALVLLALLTISGPAAAGSNPLIWAYVDFDPPWRVSRVDPAPGEIVVVPIVLNCFGYCTPGSGDYCGTYGVCFGLEVSPETAENPQFYPSLPGFELTGSWDAGFCLFGGTCAYPDPVDDILVLGVVAFQHSGTPGVVEIVDHPLYPRHVWDCESADADYYCLASNGGVGREPPEADDYCDCYYAGVGVEERPATWGTIKSLHRP